MNETETTVLNMAGKHFSTENEIFRIYLAHACINVIKMIFVAYYTSFLRIRKSVFTTKEDYEAVFGEEVDRDHVKRKMASVDVDVERARSCHRNDLENIPAFLAVGLLYTMTSPAVDVASLHFRIFTISRVMHTVAYLLPLPQPSRFLGFCVGSLSIVSMAIQTMTHGSL